MPDDPPYRITSRVDKWRFVCPEGHADWYAWDGVFSCKTCKAARDAGEDRATTYAKLRDTKTGEYVTREDLVIEDRSTRQVAPGD